MSVQNVVLQPGNSGGPLLDSAGELIGNQGSIKCPAVAAVDLCAINSIVYYIR